MKKIIFLISIFLIIFILGKDLNPFSSYFFTFHDETQPARIDQFVKELKNLHLPPRVASDMNFGIGYPIFNFYAPTAYWITGLIHLLGLDIINSLKISFLLALLTSFFCMFYLLKNFFGFYPSLLGAFFYITSLYFPLNIFVRGNLSEIWFLSLFPLSLFLVFKTTKNKKNDKKIFLTKSLILSLLITSHNIFSIFGLFLIIVLIFLTKRNFWINLISLFFSILISSYFWLPLIFELKYTWAKEVAEMTNYKNHFLCPIQLWQSPWGYGGSTSGCKEDGMSFKIGKLQLIFFVLGTILFIRNILNINNKKENRISFFFLISSWLFLFLTTYQSFFIWRIFEPFLKITQFPWRFIGFSLLGIAYFSAYFFDNLKFPLKNFLILFFIFLVIFTNQKYFTGQKIFKTEFKKRYLSKEYIEEKVAFKVAEYLPKTNDYYFWRSLEKKTPTFEEINQLSLVPFSKNSQTLIEKTANLISILSFLILFISGSKIYKLIAKNGKRV